MSPLIRSIRLQRYARRTGYFALGIGGVYVVDRTFNASAIARNWRTLWTVSLIRPIITNTRLTRYPSAP